MRRKPRNIAMSRVRANLPFFGIVARPRLQHADWEKQAANLLKSELKRKGVTYGQLVERLADIGISETEVNVANKLSRGKFSAAFMLQCANVIGTMQLRLD